MTTVKGLHNMDPLSINVDKYCPMVSWTFPRSRLADFTIALSGIGRRHRLPIPSFGHAGDGSIHVNIMYIGKDETKKAHQALQEILKLTLGLKGTLSG